MDPDDSYYCDNSSSSSTFWLNIIRVFYVRGQYTQEKIRKLINIFSGGLVGYSKPHYFYILNKFTFIHQHLRHLKQSY